MFLSDQEIQLLSSMQIFPGSELKHQVAGNWQARCPGDGNEFVDYRNYTRGEDLRYVDWHHYLAKREIVIKSFKKLENLKYYIILDLSDSVCIESANKSYAVKKIACALSFLLLNNNISVEIIRLGSDSGLQITSLAQCSAGWEYINSLESGGKAEIIDLPDCAMAFSGRNGIVISDMITAEGYSSFECAINRVSNYHSLFCVSTTAEKEPNQVGAMSMVDIETGHQVTVDIGPEQVENYKKARQEYFDGICSYCNDKRWLFYDYCVDEDFSDFMIANTSGSVFII